MRGWGIARERGEGSERHEGSGWAAHGPDRPGPSRPARRQPLTGTGAAVRGWGCLHWRTRLTPSVAVRTRVTHERREQPELLPWVVLTATSRPRPARSEHPWGVDPGSAKDRPRRSG